MHPAYSVIFFTVSSGAGYGVLFVAAALGALGVLPNGSALSWTLFVLAFALVSAGLFASLAHLGHPERAWRALSQWRSSWLSREGVAAIATYVPTGLFALGWLFFGAALAPDGRLGIPMFVLAILSAIMCAATVFATGMIYGTLKPIRQWSTGWAVAGYVAYALASGALIVNALLASLSGSTTAAPVALGALLAAAWIKRAHWRHSDSASGTTTAEAATGLGPGRVRLLDPPHTAPNYLQKEMGYRIARKHAERLRRIGFGLAFTAPAALVIATMILPGWPGAATAAIAAVSGLAGLAIERWLFFAEATHTVTLYYGAPTA